MSVAMQAMTEALGFFGIMLVLCTACHVSMWLAENLTRKWRKRR